MSMFGARPLPRSVSEGTYWGAPVPLYLVAGEEEQEWTTS